MRDSLFSITCPKFRMHKDICFCKRIINQELTIINEAGSQVEPRIRRKSTFFEDLRAHMSQSVEG